MFSLFFSKAKLIAAAVIASLLPILYLLGRRDQAKIDTAAAYKESLDAERDKADFYREMEQQNNEIQNSKPRSADELTDRLRKHGL